MCRRYLARKSYRIVSVAVCVFDIVFVVAAQIIIAAIAVNDKASSRAENFILLIRTSRGYVSSFIAFNAAVILNVVTACRTRPLAANWCVIRVSTRRQKLKSVIVTSLPLMKLSA